MDAYRSAAATPSRRERRRVVRVNEIVGEPRMVGMAPVERLREIRAASRWRAKVESLAWSWPRAIKVRRVEDLRFLIRWTAPGHSVHGTLVRQQPGTGIDRVATIVRRDGLGIVARAGCPAG